MSRYNDTDPSEIPEVRDYLESIEMLDAFRDQHTKVFQAHAELIDDARQKMQAADKIVRAKEVSCGPWEYYQKQTKYDAQALYEALGRKDFLKVGGILQKVSRFSIDKNKLEAAYVNGEVPEEVMSHVKTISPRYHAPKGGE